MDLTQQYRRVRNQKIRAMFDAHGLDEEDFLIWLREVMQKPDDTTDTVST